MLPSKNVLFNYIDDETIVGNQDVYSGVIDLKFDFNSGEFVVFDGKIHLVDKIDRVKQWIEKAIKTDAYNFRLYKYSHYGMYTEKIIGYVYDKDYIDQLLKMEIDYLMKLSDDIKETRDIVIENDGDDLNVKYTVILVDGTEFEYEGGITLYV